MTLTKAPSWRLRLAPAATAAAAPEAAWDVVHRLVEALQADPRPDARVQAALGAICDGTGADVAFLVAGVEGAVVAQAGPVAWPPEWCRALGRFLHENIPAGGLAPREALAAAGFPGAPASAAIVRVEPGRPSALVAVGLDPGRPLEAADLKVISVLWRMQVARSQQAEVSEKLKETLFGLVRCLSTAIDAKDPYTCGHSERVARIAVRLGQEMGLPRGEISDLYLAGLLHDVGKIGIRDDVLLKPGPLSSAEIDHIREHPATGDRIVANVRRLNYLRPGVRHHHERYDGRGYPDGLAGEAIPRLARIIAVADACDAMMSARRYRGAMPPAQIEAILREGAGTQWDPALIDHLMACRHDLYAVYQRGLGQSVYAAVERAAQDELEGSWTRHGFPPPR
jgi:HD-GYP domain-containing protein (c-di-GMP phosphodiesterase class II)